MDTKHSDQPTELVAPITPPSPAHETIRRRFAIADRYYIGCGFLKAGEPPVDGKTMLDRTEVEGTKPIDDEDWQHLRRHRAEFSREFQGRHYLVSSKHDPDFSGRLSCFYWQGVHWFEGSDSVSNPWSEDNLVLRRCL